MQIIDIHCWVILASSLVIMCCALLALVAKSYVETLFENFALVFIAMSSFIVCLQIFTSGFAHMSGMTFMVLSFAMYAVARVKKEWLGISKAQKIDPFPTLFF